MTSKYDWRCEMCGCTIEEAVKLRSDPLTVSVDLLVDDAAMLKFNRHFIYERTQKQPKKTCGKVCGYNYAAWLKNMDSKRQYTKDIFTCVRCHRTVEGGRVYSNGKKLVKVCRDCVRKEETAQLAHTWEIVNHDKRVEYSRMWRKNNGKKVQRYKLKSRKKHGALFAGKRIKKAWSYKYDKCRRCGTTEQRHHGFGLCHSCYNHHKGSMVQFHHEADAKD